MTRSLLPCRATTRIVVIVLLLVAFASVSPVSAQQQQSPRSSLRDDQIAISGRYDRFERLLSQMADILGYEDPERAELLRRAISKGREQKIGEQIAGIASDLEKGNLGVATEKQEQVTESLAALLKLLQSEDRRTAVEKERERLNNLLKGVQDAINQQRSARARTQNSTAPSSAAPDQQQAIRTADELLEDIKNHDDQQQRESGDKQSDSGEQQGKPSDQNSDAEGKPQEGSESESAKPDQKGSESEGMPKDPSSKPSEDPSESSPSQQSQDSDQQSQSSEGGQQSQSQSSESEQESQQTPGRQQMENARRYMQEALEGLQKQEKERAVSEQDKSLQELNEAAEELEKTLKQLREEEKEMILAALEARFQRMLTLQTAIYEGTLALAATPTEDWLDNLHSQARELAGQQAELSVDCSQTAALLREDGTSVSIVVAVEDIESDMKASAVRLKDSKVGPLTQTLQTDIIESLKELIEATQREMQEMKSDQRQQQQQQGGEQQKPPLVELMAEIKVLRSLQLRVNRRTKQIDDLFRDSDSQDAADLQEQLGELAARQHRLRESAAELAERVRKNR